MIRCTYDRSTILGLLRRRVSLGRETGIKRGFSPPTMSASHQATHRLADVWGGGSNPYDLVANVTRASADNLYGLLSLNVQ